MAVVVTNKPSEPRSKLLQVSGASQSSRCHKRQERAMTSVVTSEQSEPKLLKVVTAGQSEPMLRLLHLP